MNKIKLYNDASGGGAVIPNGTIEGNHLRWNSLTSLWEENNNVNDDKIGNVLKVIKFVGATQNKIEMNSSGTGISSLNATTGGFSLLQIFDTNFSLRTEYDNGVTTRVSKIFSLPNFGMSIFSGDINPTVLNQGFRIVMDKGFSLERTNSSNVTDVMSAITLYDDNTLGGSTDTNNASKTLLSSFVAPGYSLGTNAYSLVAASRNIQINNTNYTSVISCNNLDIDNTAGFGTGLNNAFIALDTFTPSATNTLQDYTLHCKNLRTFGGRQRKVENISNSIGTPNYNLLPNDDIVSFVLNEDGILYFPITPLEGQVYTLQLTVFPTKTLTMDAAGNTFFDPITATFIPSFNITSTFTTVKYVWSYNYNAGSGAWLVLI